MSTDNEDESTYSTEYVRLAQMYYGMGVIEFTKYPSVIEGILQRDGNLNYAVPVDSLVKLHSPDKLGYTPLHFAATSYGHNVLGLKLLLDRGADFTVKNHNGSTALHLAIESNTFNYRRCLDLKGRFEHTMANYILSAHVDTGDSTNPSCKNGISHFHIACMENNEKAVELFLKGGASVNQAVKLDSPVLPGYTPLHFAARNSSLKAVSVLLNYNADMNLKDAAGMTPLHLLVERNREIADNIKITELMSHSIFLEELKINEDIIDLLLEKHKADNAGCMSIGDIGLSHFHVACTKRMDHCVVKSLLESGADVNASIISTSPIWPGYTPLHFAAHFNIETAKLLLENGANIAGKDAKGVTPLDICIERYEPEDIHSILSVQGLSDILLSDNTKLLDIVYAIRDLTLFKEYLTNRGSTQYVTMDSPIWAGYTPLHLSVAFIKKIKTSYDLYDPYDYLKEETPDQIPYRVNNYEKLTSTEMISTCMQYDADINIKNADGMTPLHLAFRQQKLNVVKTLLSQARLMTNITDDGNLSHLHIACAEGHEQSVKDILLSNVNINDSVRSGFEWSYSFYPPRTIFVNPGSTPLHTSVIFGHTLITKLLLDHGANPLTTDADGLTPLHLAFMFHTTYRFFQYLYKLLTLAPGVKSVNPVSNEGLSYFHVACFTNNLLVAQDLLKLGLADVNAPITCQAGNTDVDDHLRFLTTDYHTSLPAAYSGYSPLHLAVKGRAMKTLKLLLSNGADPLAKNSAGQTPLQLALDTYLRFSDKNLNGSIIDRLVAAAVCGSSGTYDGNKGLTPLHVACLKVDKAAAEKALASGVDVNARMDLDSPIWPGATPLRVLVSRLAQERSLPAQAVELAQLLLERGADVNLKDANNLTPIHAVNRLYLLDKAGQTHEHPVIAVLLRSRSLLEANPAIATGYSHFHLLCERNEPSLVEEFLVRGLADVDCPADYFASYQGGCSPLHFAMGFGRGGRETVDVLLRHGANVASVDSHGSTPLHVAAQHIQPPVGLEAILSDGRADVNARNIYGETPIEMCFKNVHTNDDIIEVLLRYGARVNVVNPVTSEGFLARVFNHNKIYSIPGILKLVMEKSVDLIGVDPDTGFNAVHNIFTCRGSYDARGYVDVIEQLVKRGCELNYQDNKGRTPLHVALQVKTIKDAAEVLLELGADINIVDENGKTPLDYLEKPNSLFLDHLEKLMFVGLEVSEQNKLHCSTIEVKNTSDKTYGLELEKIKEVEIDEGYSLRDFLTEAAVTDYPSMSQTRRRAIGEIVGSSELLKKFPQLGCLLKLQYRKVLSRLKLMAKAKHNFE